MIKCDNLIKIYFTDKIQPLYINTNKKTEVINCSDLYDSNINTDLIITHLLYKVFCYLLGLFYAFAILGPAVGYLVGGAFLNIYVDVDKIDTDR